MRKMSDNSIYFIISSPLSSKMPWCLPLNFILLSSRVLAYFAFIFCRRVWRTHTLRFIGRLSLSIYIFCFSAIREKITKKWEISCVKNPIIRLKLKLFCQQILDLESSIKFTESESSSSLTLLQLKSQHLFVGRRRILMPLLLLLLSSFWHEEAMFTHSTPPLILLLLPYIFFSFNSLAHRHCIRHEHRRYQFETFNWFMIWVFLLFSLFRSSCW